MKHWIFAAFAIASLCGGQLLAKEIAMQDFHGCSLIETGWADGDSFLVKFPDGTDRTIRLYGADCIEWHVSDPTDARRLRAQRRYFGIYKAGGEDETSIKTAIKYGEIAGLTVRSLLKKNFTVSTAFANARGDGKYERFYGFVTLQDGRDLCSVLVEKGLARAYGVYRNRPGVRTSAEYREQLGDLELKAAKLGTGVWEHTDWKTLPDERKKERDEEAALDMAIDSKTSLAPNSIDPNTAARDILMKLPGIGETRANQIIEKRPFKSLQDFDDRVDGIGVKTIEKLRPFLRFSKNG